jgi:hypothetical protein
VFGRNERKDIPKKKSVTQKKLDSIQGEKCLGRGGEEEKIKKNRSSVDMYE